MATHTLTLTEDTIRSYSTIQIKGQKQEVKDIGNSELHVDLVPSTSKTSEHPGIDLVPSTTQISEHPGIDLVPSTTQTSEHPGIDLVPSTTQTSEHPGIDLVPSTYTTSEHPGIDLVPSTTQTSEHPGIDLVPSTYKTSEHPGIDLVPSTYTTSEHPMIDLVPSTYKTSEHPGIDLVPSTYTTSEHPMIDLVPSTYKTSEHPGIDLVPSTTQTSEHPGIQKQLSQPETDGIEGSTQSSIWNLISGIAIEYNETDAIDAINLNGGNTIYPQSAQPDSNPAQPDSNPAQPAMINNTQSVHQPVSLVPKIPVPRTRPAPKRQTLRCSRPIFTHNTVYPQPESHPSIAFQENYVANVTETADIHVGTNGPQCSLETANTDDSTSTQTHSKISSVESSQRTGVMSDFVILHTDEDTEAACVYKEHLHHDTGIDDLTVDLYSNVALGRSQFMSLSTLHDNYRYILTYVTDNLTSDRHTRFLEEILITYGLRTGNGNEDRVVPVLTRNEQNTDCTIIELCILGSLQYHRFQSSNGVLKKYYIESVRNLVKTGRKKFV